MTRFGWATTVGGVAALVVGLTLGWPAFDLLGLGLLLVALAGALTVARPARLVVDREIQPPRVPKGEPAIAFLTFANRGRRTAPLTVATQPFGPHRVRTVIPRLRGGERGTRAYRLPTTRRGVFDVAPVELTHSDAFELFRRTRHQGRPERIWVQPRILALRPLPTGRSRTVEGPSSDTSPQGSVTFHRLRDYVPGDDLRLVHWPSSARAGTLLVKHNVDTSLPYTVVVLDQRPAHHTEQGFEDAVDVAASVVMTASAGRAPVELRTTDGSVLGGGRQPDPTPLVDALTAVSPTEDGDLRTVLTALRRSTGGTSLVVVTGTLDTADIPAVAALRRRFDRIVVVSIDPLPRAAAPRSPGVEIIVARDASSAATAWNARAGR